MPPAAAVVVVDTEVVAAAVALTETITTIINYQLILFENKRLPLRTVFFMIF